MILLNAPKKKIRIGFVRVCRLHDSKELVYAKDTVWVKKKIGIHTEKNQQQHENREINGPLDVIQARLKSQLKNGDGK